MVQGEPGAEAQPRVVRIFEVCNTLCAVVHNYSAPLDVVIGTRFSRGHQRNLSDLLADSLQEAAYEFPRIPLPRTWVNELSEETGAQCMKGAGVFKNPSPFLGRSEGKDYPSEPPTAPQASVPPWPSLMHFWTKLSKFSELK
jgi:hypothetical protein